MQLGIGIYVKNSKEAVALYCEAFGLELGYHVLNEDGNYYHSDLLKEGKPFLCVAEANENNLPNGINLAYDNPVELGHTVDTKEEFDRVFALMKKHGRVLMDVSEFPWSPLCAVVMDQYGVRWYITLPQHRPAEDAILP